MNRLTRTPDRYGLMNGPLPFVWRGTLTWSLYGRVLHLGLVDAMRIVEDRVTVGANTICCSLMLSWGFPFSPSTPGFWDQLLPFVRACASINVRVCFIVFADSRFLMPDQPAQLAHWQRIYTHLAGEDNVTLVLANQAGHPTQHIDIWAFDKPQPIAGFPALLSAIDNPFEDSMPTEPFWDFSLFCSKRNDPNWWTEGGGYSMANAVLLGANGRPPSERATVLFEPPPAGRQPQWSDPGKWRQFARSHAFKGTIGGNIYSDFDAQSQIYPSGVVRDCAVEYLGNLPRP